MPYPQTQAPQGTGAQPSLTSVASPSGSGSSSFVCLGLGAAGAVITPLASGRVKVDISAVGGNSVIAGTLTAQIIYGTGAAPANGAAVPGGAVAIGSQKAFVASTAAGVQGLNFSAVVNALTLGTPYWFDVQFKVPGASGTATLSGVDVVLTEV